MGATQSDTVVPAPNLAKKTDDTQHQKSMVEYRRVQAQPPVQPNTATPPAPQVSAGVMQLDEERRQTRQRIQQAEAAQKAVEKPTPPANTNRSGTNPSGTNRPTPEAAPPVPRWSAEDRAELNREAQGLTKTGAYGDYLNKYGRFALEQDGERAAAELREIKRLHRDALGPNGVADADRFDREAEALITDVMGKPLKSESIGRQTGFDPTKTPTMDSIPAGVDTTHLYMVGLGQAPLGTSHEDAPGSNRTDPVMQHRLKEIEENHRLMKKRVEDAQAGEPTLQALSEETGTKVTWSQDNLASLDFGDGAVLSDLEPWVATKIAVTLKDNPDALAEVKAFAAGKLDLEALDRELVDLNIAAEVYARYQATHRGRGGHGPNAPPKPDQERIARLTALYYAGKAQEQEEDPLIVQAFLSGGYGEDPFATRNLIANIAVGFMPVAGPAADIYDISQASIDFYRAYKAGDEAAMKQAAGNIGLSAFGFMPGADLLRGLRSGKSLRQGLIDSTLKLAAGKQFGQGGTWRARAQLELARRQADHLPDDPLSAKGLSGEMWGSLTEKQRQALNLRVSAIKGKVGEDLMTNIMRQAGFSLSNEAAERRYRIKTPDGKEPVRIYDAVSPEVAQTRFGIFLSPVKSADGKVTAYEIKTDGGIRNPKQKVQDARATNPDYKSSKPSKAPPNPDIREVELMRVQTSQLPEGELATAVQKGLENKYPKELVDQIVSAIRLHDELSRIPSSGVKPIAVGVLLAAVLGALPVDETTKTPD